MKLTKLTHKKTQLKDKKHLMGLRLHREFFLNEDFLIHLLYLESQ